MPVKREYINPPDLASPRMGLYNHVVKAGNTAYISGQVSRGLDGRTLYPGDIQGQVRQIWANLEKAVQAAGGSVKDIVKTTTYVVGVENLEAMYQARLALLLPEGRPTSATVVVSALSLPDLLVEMEAIAVIDDDTPA